MPVEVRAGQARRVRVESDDHLRPDTTLEGLAALPPAFGKDGFVTAGNASGIVDGAAALVVASRDEAQGAGPASRWRASSSWGVVGVPPGDHGHRPGAGARARRWRRPGSTLEDIDLVEINEAFAGQYLAVEKELGLDREKVNVNGGAIALGHPLGRDRHAPAAHAALELRRRKGRYGLATACIGGGQGIAMIVESREERYAMDRSRPSESWAAA